MNDREGEEKEGCEVVNFIWQTKDGDETTFQSEFLIKVVFRNVKCCHHFDGRRFEKVLDNSLILYCDDSRETDEDFKQYIYKFIVNRFNFSLFHFSNENLHHNAFYYSSAKRVFRNYYDRRIEKVHKNVTFLPLGFKSGFFNDSFDFEDIVSDRNLQSKRYDFCFIGQIKSDRKEIHDWICERVPKERSFIHLISRWSCSSSLSPEGCVEIYKKTRFVPCPMGSINADSFRIAESLEWGAIPIIRSYPNSPLGPDAGDEGGLDYHNKVWGEDSPIPVVSSTSSWEEGLENFRKMTYEEYKKLAHTVFQWYSKFRKEGQTIEKVVL